MQVSIILYTHDTIPALATSPTLVGGEKVKDGKPLYWLEFAGVTMFFQNLDQVQDFATRILLAVEDKQREHEGVSATNRAKMMTNPYREHATSALGVEV